MKNKIAVRFHLAKGKNFMKWQVKRGKTVAFFDPQIFTLVMKGTRLMNQRGSAEKIHEGANKTVCAWIECDDVGYNH